MRCATCDMPVRQGFDGNWYHDGGDKFTDTIARRVWDRCTSCGRVAGTTTAPCKFCPDAGPEWTPGVPVAKTR